MRQILDGIRVIDAGTVLAAPGSSALLADFGAEVIKVEQPVSGDPIRRYPPHVTEGGERPQSLVSKVTNRGKRSITLDLNAAQGQALFKRLVTLSDAVVLNYRPRTLKRWHLDYDDLRCVKPDIIMLHLTGYGRTGPYFDRPGFARAVEGFVGLTYMTGFPDRPPIPSGYAVADALGGVFGALSLMLALYQRRVTGAGELIDYALYEGMMRVMDGLYIGYDQGGVVPERVGTINPGIAPHDIYQTRDEAWVAIPASTQNMFVRLCEVLGLSEVVSDPDFKTNVDRVAHREVLDRLIRPRILDLDVDDLVARADKVGLALSRINSVADFLGDTHVAERGSTTRVWDENLHRSVLMQSVVPRLQNCPGEIRWPGHEAGQDNDLVFGELLGIDADEREKLKVNGVI